MLPAAGSIVKLRVSVGSLEYLSTDMRLVLYVSKVGFHRKNARFLIFEKSGGIACIFGDNGV
jgi:hypothetical protein